MLFGEVWSRENKLALRDRSIITVTALMTKGIFDKSLKYHITNAKKNGVTKDEMVEIVTQLAFYSGWPNAWATMPIVMEVYKDDVNDKKGTDSIFPLGDPNDGFSKYFIGQSYLAPLSTSQIGIYHVTFEPACRNNWHIHHASKGGGQILVVTGGIGYYQEWGKDVQVLHPGDIVNIPAEVKHWHGAVADQWFSHLAIEVPGEDTSNQWCEAVTDDEYKKNIYAEK